MTTRDQHLTAHRDEQIVENALWLLNDVGLHRDQVCKRLGLTWDTLEKKMARVNRRRSAESDPASVEADGQDEGDDAVLPVRVARPPG